MRREQLFSTRSQNTPSYIPSTTAEEFILATRNGPITELRVLILQGARGDGKTSSGIAACLALAERVAHDSPERLPLIVAVVRDTGVNLKRTTLVTIKEFERKGLRMTWREQDREALVGDPGHPLVHFHFFGVDTMQEADKFQGLTMAVLWLEEVAPAADLSAGIPAETFGLGVTSIRQRGVPKRCLVTMNPPDSDAWILRAEDKLAEYGAASVRVARWAMPAGEKEHHFRRLAEQARDPHEAAEWETAADEFRAYREACEAALVSIGREDLVGRLVAGQVGEVKVGEPVVPKFVRNRHAVDALVPVGSAPIIRCWDGGGCYDSETEVLTITGWRRFDALTGNEPLATRTVDGRLEYHRPTRLICRPHSGPMYRYRTHNVDFLLTPEHEVPLLKEWTCWRETSARCTAEDLSWLRSTHSGVPLRADLDEVDAGARYGPLEWSAEVYAAFVGWYLSEGSVSHGTVTLYQSTRNESLKTALDGTGLVWKDTSAYGAFAGYQTWNPALAAHLAPLGLARTKRLSLECWALSRPATSILLEAFVRGDGTIRRPRHGWKGGEWVANTSSERLAGELQALAMRAGMYARVFARPAQDKVIRDRGGRTHVAHGGPAWRVSFKTRSRVGMIDGKRMTVEPYDGLVYCATVPNGTLYVRRNGIAHWNGNSPSTVIMQPLGQGGLGGLNILASHTSLNTTMEDHIRDWVIPTMTMLGIMPTPRRDPLPHQRDAYATRSIRQLGWTYRDIGDPSLLWEGGTVKSENTSGLVIQEMLGASFEAGPVEWDARREALNAIFHRSGDGEREKFVRIDRRYNTALIQALAGRFRYPKRISTNVFTPTIEAAKKASGPAYSGVPDALAYGLAVLYPAADWLRQILRRPVPKSLPRRSWLAG